MSLEKKKAFLIAFAYFAVILFLIGLAINYLSSVFFPFILALAIAFLLQPIIRNVEKLTGISRSKVAILTLFAFYGILIFILSMFGTKIFLFLRDSFFQLPSFYVETIQPYLETAIGLLAKKFPNINLYFSGTLSNINKTLFSYITGLSSKVVAIITGLAGRIPALIINILFTIVSSFFFTIDFPKITRFVLIQFPEKRREMILMIKHNAVQMLGKIIRSYAILMTLTFTELSIGFFLLGIQNPFLLALIVSIVDILPVLGTGAVLLPWCLISFVVGNTPLGVGLLVLYLFITIVRQTLEPKLIGHQVGLHPIVMLICIFTGAKLFGLVGIFLFPITATMLKRLNDDGTIHLFKMK